MNLLEDILVKLLGMILTVLILGTPITFLAYTQRYVYDNNTTKTATKGIWFKQTILLNKYKKVSCGNSLFGKYCNYTRSDRHDELVPVYFK